jgi:hypothetical protein
MRTCRRFVRISSDFQQEIRRHESHAQRHHGEPSAKTSAKLIIVTRRKMAQALARHVAFCPECG